VLEKKNHITWQRIREYLSGKLSSTEQHEIEKKSLYSPFEREAMEGLEEFNPEDLQEDISFLESRIERNLEKKKLRPWHDFSFYKIAASISLLFVSVVITYYIFDSFNTKQEMTAQEAPTENIPVETDTVSKSAGEDYLALNKEKDTRENIEKRDNSAGKPREKFDSENKPGLIQDNEISPNYNLFKSESSPSIPSSDNKNEATISETEEDIAEVDSEDPLLEAPLQSEEINVARALQGRISGVAIDQQELQKKPTDISLDNTGSNKKEEELPGGDLNDVAKNQPVDTPSKKAREQEPSLKVARSKIPSPTTASVVNELIEEETRKVKGVVMDKYSGEPLPGTSIIQANTANGTASDEHGQFSLTLKGGENSQNLMIDFIGYTTATVDVSSKDSVTVYMEPDLNSLSEVVVVGYGIEKGPVEEVFTKAAPTGGMASFKKYLNENIDSFILNDGPDDKGRVVLELTVDERGTITDIKVVRSLCAVCDKEVTRLILEGPDWQPTRRNDQPETDTLRISVRFK